MNRKIKWAASLVIVLLVSAACELGVVKSTPTPVPEQVQLSVLVQPADKGFVELDGSLITPGIAVPVKTGKQVNLVAKSLDEKWRFINPLAD